MFADLADIGIFFLLILTCVAGFAAISYGIFGMSVEGFSRTVAALSLTIGTILLTVSGALLYQNF